MDKKQYGWVICMACALLLFCTGGLSTTGFSAYQPYLISIGGLTNTQASTVVLLRNLFGLLGMLVTTPLIRRFEVRRLVTFAMVLCGISFIIYGLSDGFGGYCAASSLAGCAFGLGGMIPASVLITRWFREHRGLALGICMAATGLSVIVASPFITIVVENFSLSASFTAEAVFVFAAAVVVYLLLRSRPACLNTEPIGAEHEGVERSFAQHKSPKGLYMCMMVGILLFGMPGNTLYSHISVLYQSTGFKSMDISWLLSVFGIALTIGKCVYGQIADKIGTYRSSWILYALTAVGTAFCCMARNGNFVIAAAGVVLMGFGLAVTTVSISMYAAGVTIEEDYSATVTRFQVLSTLGALVFGVVPGMIADTMGDYVPAFAIMLILVIISACILQFTYHQIRLLDRHS